MRWTVRGLIIPFVIVICVLLAGAGSARAGKKANVEVGFVGAPPAGFQNVLLNVQRVRINPRSNAGPGNNQWQAIPVPPGIGGSGQSAELQIDLNTSQNVPQLFNTAAVRADNYKLAELDLDPNNPGTIIADCPAAPAADGCVNYPIQLSGGLVITTPISGVAPKNGHLATLVLQVSMTINQPPAVVGGPYTVTVTISPAANPGLGTITGTVNAVTSAGTGTTTKVRKLAVTAEAIGTGTPIATVLVKNNQFTLALPAADDFGTLYDLALAGGADTYEAMRLPPLLAGTSNAQAITFTPTTNQALGNITGSISDGCVAKKPIVGATLQLLIPPDSNPMADCFHVATVNQCVTVATANTDPAGDFPLPGTITTPAAFENVPMRKKSNPYAMEVTAPGYDPVIVQAVPNAGAGKSGGGSCSIDNGTTFGRCDLTLPTGYISGTVPIIPPPSGQTTMVQVFAEDHGTNTIESVMPMPISVKSSNPGTVSFTLNVPTSDMVPAGFDLFATTIDLYQGVTDPYQGHTIAVLANVAAPAMPSGLGVCNTTAGADFSADDPISCIGHGSITSGPGGVANADLGTSVVLSKQDVVSGDFVQITNMPVQNLTPNTSPSNAYAFCAPADTYWLQTSEIPAPEPGVVPSAAPTPEPTASPTVSVTIPPAPLIMGPPPSPTPTPTPTGSPSPTATPSSTPTPKLKCPTTCSNLNGSCPGICNNMIQPL